jgi:hypothetical protein
MEMIEICFKHPYQFLSYKNDHYSLMQIVTNEAGYIGVEVSHKASLKLLLLAGREVQQFFAKYKILDYVENR